MTPERISVDFEHFFNALASPYIAFMPNDHLFTIVAQNNAHAAISMTSEKVVVGRDLFEVFPDNSEKFKTTGHSDLLESLRTVIETGKPDLMPILHYDVRNPNGEFVERWWRVTHYPVFDTTGNLELIYQSTEDITDETIASNKLQLAKTQLDSALAIGLVSTWYWEIDTDIVIGDDNLVRSFGISPELAGRGLPLKTFTDAIHIDDRDRVLKAITLSAATGGIYEQEYRTITHNGETRWVIARGRYEVDLTGKTALLGVLVDITKRKKAEQELETIRSMFNALFESDILCIVMADMNGNVLKANQTFLKTFDYTQEDLDKGLNSSEITPTRSKGISDYVYQKLEDVGEVEPVEKEYMRRDGTTIPMLVGAAMLPNNKDLFIAFMLDISENKELRALNRAKDEFIEMASHQLRTPATAVKQYLSLLQTGFAGDLTRGQSVFADKAYTSNERQIKIINDLLKTAQIDSNHFMLRKEHVTVSELIKRAITDLDEALLLKEQTVRFEGKPNSPKVFVDLTELNLVFVNLIENASKYSERGTNVEIKVITSGHMVEVSVIDHGVGIAEDDRKRIFDKFTRVDNSLSDTVTGSGLGLYWVRRIIDLHRGTIRVMPNNDGGTIFVVSLPYES